MRLLAIDTSGPVLGIALGDGTESGTIVHCEGNRELPPRHIEILTPRIQQVLHEAGWAAGSLSAIAVSSGPGSFTGLRIGFATAKGIALASEIPVVGVNTLDAIAHGVNLLQEEHLGATAPEILVAATDARKGRCYAAIFRRELRQHHTSQRLTSQRLSRLSPDMDVTVQELSQRILERIPHTRGSAEGVAPDNPHQPVWQLSASPGLPALEKLLSLLPPPTSSWWTPLEAAIRGVLAEGAVKVEAGDGFGDYAGPDYLRASDIGSPGRSPQFSEIHRD